MDRSNWKLGDTASLFESHGEAGTVSLGVGDNGGVSYGIYQLSSKSGTAREYVVQSRYASDFKGLTPGSDDFNTAWKKVARDHPDFGDDQHEFIKRTHMDPVVDKLSEKGIDVYSRGPAFQDMVWSMSVQYRANTPARIERGLTEAYGPDVDISSLSDADVVRAVHDSKLVHVHEDFRSSTPRTRQGVETRITAESAALVRLAETGSVGTVAETNADFRAASPVARGSAAARVTDMQDKLIAIGILLSDGKPLVADGDFGPSTQAAVRTFQSSVGLPQTGEAGALTLRRLDEQVAGRKHLVEERSAAQAAPTVCRLDDSNHPDNAFFQNVRQHVHNLDQSLGRVPDQYSDNLASALTVQARADGMHRVDQVALSKDGNAIWAVQTPPGRRDHIFDLSTKIPTAECCTPMEQSGARWPAAMQQFQDHEIERAQSQQRSQERTQSDTQVSNMSSPSMGL